MVTSMRLAFFFRTSAFYNEYGKVDMITDSVKGSSTRFFYGPEQECWYSHLHRDNKLVRSTIYAGDYEEFYENGDF